MTEQPYIPTSPAVRLPAERQLRLFVESIFSPDDLVELRVIELVRSAAKPTGRVILRDWQPPESLFRSYRRLDALNRQGANIYFGVNPRAARAGTKDAIRVCRTIWADLDRVSYADAVQRWRPRLPEPTAIVNSGHGIHLYWRLSQAVDVASSDRRLEFEAMLKALYRHLGSDSTQDVTRLLRLPGFLNVKDAPVPCELIRADADRRYPLSVFSDWFNVNESESRQPPDGAVAEIAIGDCFPRSRDIRRIRGVIAILERDATDRSRRDFWCVCLLLRLGLSVDEIRALVSGRSKFTTEAYLEQTLQNALKAVHAS
jgi:hypothetical protein